MGEPYFPPTSPSLHTSSPPPSPTQNTPSSSSDETAVSEVSTSLFSSSSSSSSSPPTPIEIAIPFETSSAVSLVDRLTGYIGSLVETPNSILTSEKLPFIRPWVELGLTHFPPSPTPTERTDEELTKNLLFKAFKGMWEKVTETVPSSSSTAPDASSQRFFQHIQGPVSAYFAGQTDVHTMMEELKQTIPPEGLDTMLQERLDAINHVEGAQYRSLAEAGTYQHRTMIRKLIDRQMPDQAPYPPDFLKRMQELFGRTSSFSTFAECVVEDVLQGKTVENSRVLQLLDLFVIDFMQTDRESIWFQSPENNFGYRRSEEEWRAIIQEGSIHREAIHMLMNMFEHVLDFFHEPPPEGELSNASAVLEIVDHLDWILAAPLEEIYNQVPKQEEEAICRYHNVHRAFQESFIRWAIEKSKETMPELADKDLLKELKIRLMMAAYIVPNSIPPENRSERRLALAKGISPLIRNAVQAAHHAAGNLIASRNPAGPNLDLVFGFGFQGWLFSNQPNARHQPNAILLNVSERGRRLPEKPNDIGASLFSLPFLYAAQLLLQIAHQQVQQLEQPEDVIPLIILGEPTEEDKKVHRYLFERLITHAFTHPNIQLHPRFWDGRAREEIANALSSYARTYSLKGVPQANRVAERARLGAIAEEIGRKITEISHPRLTPNELQFLLRALANKSSICVESVISRHSKNNLIVPLSFDPQRHDVITIDGQLVKIDTRGVIPPCDRYCQLLSGSHQLWADLNRNPTMDQLDQRSRESGQGGIQPTSPWNNGASSSVAPD